MRWFRLYTEIIHDPKVQLLPAATFREWINVLCVACENGGQLPDDKDVAFTLRMSLMATRAMLLRLLDAKLLERTVGGKLKPHNWDSRQFQSDVSTERVKRFREKKKAASGNADETFHETKSKRPRACDTESETETESPISPSQAAEGAEIYELFREAFVGPIESDLWQDFARLIRGAEDARVLVPNTKLWMQTERYRKGFHSALSFLRSGVWRMPPQASLLSKIHSNCIEEIDYPQ